MNHLPPISNHGVSTFTNESRTIAFLGRSKKYTQGGGNKLLNILSQTGTGA